MLENEPKTSAADVKTGERPHRIWGLELALREAKELMVQLQQDLQDGRYLPTLKYLYEGGHKPTILLAQGYFPAHVLYDEEGTKKWMGRLADVSPFPNDKEMENLDRFGDWFSRFNPDRTLLEGLRQYINAPAYRITGQPANIGLSAIMTFNNKVYFDGGPPADRMKDREKFRNSIEKEQVKSAYDFAAYNDPSHSQPFNEWLESAGQSFDEIHHYRYKQEKQSGKTGSWNDWFILQVPLRIPGFLIASPDDYEPRLGTMYFLSPEKESLPPHEEVIRAAQELANLIMRQRLDFACGKVAISNVLAICDQITSEYRIPDPKRHEKRKKEGKIPIPAEPKDLRIEHLERCRLLAGKDALLTVPQAVTDLTEVTARMWVHSDYLWGFPEFDNQLDNTPAMRSCLDQIASNVFGRKLFSALDKERRKRRILKCLSLLLSRPFGGESQGAIGVAALVEEIINRCFINAPNCESIVRENDPYFDFLQSCLMPWTWDKDAPVLTKHIHVGKITDWPLDEYPKIIKILVQFQRTGNSLAAK